MSIPLMLSFKCSAPEEVTGTDAYWALDEEGRWVYAVRQIAEYWQIPATQVPARVQEFATAFRLDKRCAKCRNPLALKSRSDLTKDPGYQNTCSQCLSAEAEERRTLEAARLRAETEAQNAIWLRETADDSPFDYRQLELRDAIYAYALFVGSEVSDTGEIQLFSTPPFSASLEGRSDAIRRLRSLRVLRFGKSTPLQAFKSHEKPGYYTFFIDKVSWQFAPSAVTSSVRSIMAELRSVLSPKTVTEEYWRQVNAVWWEVARNDAFKHLNETLNKYGLEVTLGNALSQAFDHALENFSVPQVRNLIWRVSRDTAAYAQTDVPRARAINSVPGRLTRVCDRALAEGWEIKPYVLRWDEEETLVTTTLFDAVLRSGTTGFQMLTGSELRRRAGTPA